MCCVWLYVNIEADFQLWIKNHYSSSPINYGYKSENYKIVSSREISDDDLPPKNSYLCIEHKD